MIRVNPNTGLPEFADDPVHIRGSGIVSGGGGTAGIPQYDTDPVSPNPEDAWVLHSTSGGSGGGTILAMMGGGFMASSVGTSTDSYQFSYRTLEGTTKRATLT